MFPISEIGRVYDKTVCEGKSIIRASLHGKAVLELVKSPRRCKDCRTYNPPDGGGGRRWSEERFSNPEGSSYRDGGGRTFLGGKCGCDTSGSLAYGEGDARCPAPGEADPRLKKLMARSCKEESGPQNRKLAFTETRATWRAIVECWLQGSVAASDSGTSTGTAAEPDRISNYIIFAYPIWACGTRNQRCSGGSCPSSMSSSPQPSPPPDPSGGGVFDDFPVDRKSCQLLGPTALV